MINENTVYIKSKWTRIYINLKLQSLKFPIAITDFYMCVSDFENDFFTSSFISHQLDKIKRIALPKYIISFSSWRKSKNSLDFSPAGSNRTVEKQMGPAMNLSPRDAYRIAKVL